MNTWIFDGPPIGGMSRLEWIALLVPALVWVVSFIFYAIRCAIVGMPRTERIDRIAQSPYLPRIVMEFGYAMFTLPIALLVRLRVTPNMITAGALVCTAVAAGLYGTGHFGIGGWILFLAFSCDAWDGIVARKTNQVSVTGEFFDSTIDRYSDLIGFLGFMYYYREDPLPLGLAALALVGSTVTSYSRAKGECVGVDPNVGYMQRHERAVYLGSALVFSPMVAAFVEPGVAHPFHHLVVVTLGLIAVLTNITAIWRIRYVLKGLEARGRSLPSTEPLPPVSPRPDPSERPERSDRVDRGDRPIPRPREAT